MSEWRDDPGHSAGVFVSGYLECVGGGCSDCCERLVAVTSGRAAGTPSVRQSTARGAAHAMVVTHSASLDRPDRPRLGIPTRLASGCALTGERDNGLAKGRSGFWAWC